MSANTQTEFDLSSLFDAVATAIPDQLFLVWRDKRLTYGEMNSRVGGVAHYLHSLGLGCHAERESLAGHQSGQDQIGLYLRNGNEYLEAMLGGYRARTAPFNCNYRYVEEELLYLLDDANATALVYNAEFAPRVAAVRDQLPRLRHLIQVEDESGNALLPGAVSYESITATPAPVAAMPKPTGDDLYVLYTGGTTGMPKGVLWRQHDIFVSSMGGRPFGSTEPFESYDAIVDQARSSAGGMSFLVIPPFMHGSAQWVAIHAITFGGFIAIPDSVDGLRPAEALRLAEREGVRSIPVIGDAVARPLLAEIETGAYDLSSVMIMTNAGATMSPGVRKRLLAALPGITLIDAVGASESGTQMSVVTSAETADETPMFSLQHDSAVLSTDLSEILGEGAPGDGWLARRDYVPLGYLGDPEKTARTFPTVGGVRWAVPGDKARVLPDGRIQLLGRDSMMINSGGEKVFVEEVELAVSAHPDIYDVVVVGRPSELWGSEVVAVIQLVEGANPTDAELDAVCAQKVARYKTPKAFIRTPRIMRSPAGKADYRWAAELAAATHDSLMNAGDPA